MKLYGRGYCHTDGRFRLCGRFSGNSPSAAAGNGVVTDVVGQEDKISLARLLKIKDRVYCTPRCHKTQSWEVGLVQDYLVRFLVGNVKITSFDYHVMQSMEVIQIFLHALEIQEQSGPQLTLYGALCAIGKKPFSPLRKQREIRAINDPVLEVLVRLKYKIKEYIGAKTTELSATDLLLDMEKLRRMYFDGLHLCLLSRHGLEQKSFLRQLGRLHGMILGRSAQLGLKIRRYYRAGKYFEQVFYFI